MMSRGESIAERILPHDLEAERAVLGAILVDAEAWPRAAAIVRAEDFFRDAHRRIYDGMVALNGRGVPIDFILLRDELTRAGDLDEVGGPAYVASLADGVPRSTNVEHYATIVREKAALRGLIAAATKTVAAAYEARDAATAVADQGVSALLAYVDTRQARIVRADQAAVDYVMGLDRSGSDSATTLATGYLDLDEVLDGGLRAQDLVIVAGRPSSGKSSLALCLGRSLARHGVPTAMFPLEMRTAAIAARLISGQARVEKRRMAGRFLSESDYGRLTSALGALDGLPLYLQDSASSLVEISAWCQRLKGEYGIRCAIVDYLQLMLPDRRSASREADVATLSRGLKRLARTQDLVVIAVSALNRAPEGRRDNRPRLSDLRESGALEYDADVVLLLFRAEQYDSDPSVKGLAEVIVAKNREGPLGVVKLAFLDSLGGLFENLAQPQPEMRY